MITEDLNFRKLELDAIARRIKNHKEVEHVLVVTVKRGHYYFGATKMDRGECGDMLMFASFLVAEKVLEREGKLS